MAALNKLALVTGGYGFLGRATARMFKSRGYRVIGIGNGRWDSSEAFSHGFDTWLDASVTMSSLLALNETFDVIVHCAGNGSVGYSLTNPLQDFEKTVESTAGLLEYIRLSNPAALLIYPSSAGVYGTKKDSPIKVNDSLNPISPYGYHKKMVEELCESYSKSYGLKVAIIRFFSIYGPGLKKQLLWDASNKLASAKDTALFWGTGEETRDWIYVEDAAELICKVAQSNDDLFNVINGASGIRTTVSEVLTLLRDALAVDVKILFNNIVREGDPRFYHADILESQKIGWTAKVPLQNGIHQYVEWFRRNSRD